MPENTAPKLFARNAVPLTSEARAEQGIKPNENKQGSHPVHHLTLCRLFRRFTQPKAQEEDKNSR